MSHGSGSTNSRFPQGAEPSWRPDPVADNLERWWDGQHWTDHTRQVAADGQEVRRAREEVQPPNRLIAVGAQLGLAVASLALVAMALSIFLVWNETVTAIDMGEIADPKVLDLSQRGYTVSLVAAVVLTVLALVGVLGWFVARYDHPRVNERARRRGLVGAVVGWFIPVANLWLVPQGLTDLWYAARPELRHVTAAPKLPMPGSIRTAVTAAVLAVVLFASRGVVGGLDLWTESADRVKLGLTVTGGMGLLSALLVLLALWSSIVMISQVEESLRLDEGTSERIRAQVATA